MGLKSTPAVSVDVGARARCKFFTTTSPIMPTSRCRRNVSTRRRKWLRVAAAAAAAAVVRYYTRLRSSKTSIDGLTRRVITELPGASRVDDGHGCTWVDAVRRAVAAAVWNWATIGNSILLAPVPPDFHTCFISNDLVSVTCRRTYPVPCSILDHVYPIFSLVDLCPWTCPRITNHRLISMTAWLGIIQFMHSFVCRSCSPVCLPAADHPEWPVYFDVRRNPVHELSTEINDTLYQQLKSCVYRCFRFLTK